MRVILFLFATSLIGLTCNVHAQDYTLVTIPGANIQRTMNLLEKSTPLKRNSVRILFYGQSITAQDWWKEVAEFLIMEYPYADLIIENRAIGGFTAPQLVKTAEFDLYPFYPDLLIFHDYGCNSDGSYEEMIRKTRERTTAEIILITNHFIGRKSDCLESECVRKLAVKYSCGLIDMETYWQKLLKRKNLEPSELLSSGPHLNKKGNQYYAEYVKKFFCRNLKFDHIKSYGEVSFIDKQDTSCVRYPGDGSVQIHFTGNRIDVIPEEHSCYINASPMAEVWIDNRKPSDFQEAYFITRPSAVPYVLWPAFRVLTHNTPLVEEDWTLTVLKSTPDGKEIQFNVFGSVTGEDGEGINTEKFVSNSGRVVIEGGDEWVVARALDYKKKEMPDNYKVTWRIEPHFQDLLSFPDNNFDGTDNAVTLIEGIPNGPHVLRLIPWPGAQLRIKGIRAYRPSSGRDDTP